MITLVVATGKLFLDIPKEQIKETQGKLLAYFHDLHPEIAENSQTDKVLADDLREQILSVAEEFLGQNK